MWSRTEIRSCSGSTSDPESGGVRKQQKKMSERKLFSVRMYGKGFLFLQIPGFCLQNALTYTKIDIKVAESG